MQIIEKVRKTKETEIEIKLNLYGEGRYKISTGVKFFDHMLEQLAYHSGFDIELKANSLDGDLHHMVEDVAITLAQAVLEALGDKRGIMRYAHTVLPMDDALCLCALDFSGRVYSRTELNIKEEKTSGFETILIPHFYNSFAQNALVTLHIKTLEGYDPHHIIEASFKAFAKCLKTACSVDKKNPDKINSTKGVL